MVASRVERLCRQHLPSSVEARPGVLLGFGADCDRVVPEAPWRARSVLMKFNRKQFFALALSMSLGPAAGCRRQASRPRRRPRSSRPLRLEASNRPTSRPRPRRPTSAWIGIPAASASPGLEIRPCRPTSAWIGIPRASASTGPVTSPRRPTSAWIGIPRASASTGNSVRIVWV